MPSWDRSIDVVGGTVKNVAFGKVKSVQLVINSLQGFSEAVKLLAPSINAVYLPKIESIIDAKDTKCAKKITSTLNVHKLVWKVNANGNLYINFFKIANDDEPYHVQWYGGENDIICGHDKSSNSDDQCAKSDGMYEKKNV